MSRLRLKRLLGVIGLLGACGTTLQEGELGTARLVGYVRGAPPAVQVLAPSADRAGNIYILAGSKRFPETTVYVGRAGGGFASGCRLGKGDTYGPFGWLGFASAARENGTSVLDVSRSDRQWYWSGAALVRVTSQGDCRRVLDRDPSTGTDLLFDAVLPRVYETATRTSLVALVRAQVETLPFTIRVDLNANTYTSPRGFEPATAKDLVIHGVGASGVTGEGWVLASFVDGGAALTEARFYDVDGVLLARAPIENRGDPIPPYGVRGFLQGDKNGLVAGLLDDGRVVVFDRGRGRVVDGPSMEAVGVHTWRGALYVVGSRDDGAAVARIGEDGAIGAVLPWAASRAMAETLGGPLDVTDDRAPPRRTERITPRATGRAPFVTEHSPHPYADGTTLLTIAGPTVGEGDASFTLIAVAPAGITYP